MTVPARAQTKPADSPMPAIERARRGLPLVAQAEASDDQIIDVRAWARQVVAVALELEGVDVATLHPSEDL